jgi:hypothetical protein
LRFISVSAVRPWDDDQVRAKYHADAINGRKALEREEELRVECKGWGSWNVDRSAVAFLYRRVRRADSFSGMAAVSE